MSDEKKTEDLSEITINDDFEYQVTHPKTGVGIDLHITVCGPDSPEAKAAFHKLNNRRLQSKNSITSELQEAENIDLMVARTKSIRGDMTINGKDVDSYNSPEGFRELYRNRKLAWVKVQVDTAMSDRANFVGE